MTLSFHAGCLRGFGSGLRWLAWFPWSRREWRWARLGLLFLLSVGTVGCCCCFGCFSGSLSFLQLSSFSFGHLFLRALLRGP